MIDLSRSRLPPYDHQVVGVQRIVDNPFFFLADEMGAGKTKQTIDAAQVLCLMGEVDRVVIICPAAVRSVWFDPELGELAKHLWARMPANVIEYHAKVREWEWFTNFEGVKAKPKIEWIITNYDFIRNTDRRTYLRKQCSKKTLLVLDESSAVKNWSALQTKACKELRSYCGRVLLLNGTPIANSPGDLYSQADIMHPKILGCKNFFHFRARYAKMGGWQGRQIVGWHDIDDLQDKLAPYVVRRLKEQCLDLPSKIPTVPLAIPLTPATWKIYKEMKDDMVAWLNTVDVSSASQAIVKAMRLAQITSGFIGGVERQEDLFSDLEDAPAFVEKEDQEQVSKFLEEMSKNNPTYVATLREIGREKLDAFLTWLDARLEEDVHFKVLVWSRFRPEVHRLYGELEKYKKVARGLIIGGQKKADRDMALRLLDPRTAPPGPAVVVGTPQTGSMGLNLTAAHTVVYLSNDFSLKTRLQSEDRVHRPGQVHAVSYFDFIATGPTGQKTIDHSVVKALTAKKDMADFTTSAWLDALLEE